MQHPLCGDRVGDSYAKKQKHRTGAAADPRQALPTLPEAPSSSKGTAVEPIPVEEADGPECFKCGRVGHFQIYCEFKPLCVLCQEEGHALAYCPTRGKPLQLQIMGNAIPGQGFFCLPFVEGPADEDLGEAWAVTLPSSPRSRASSPLPCWRRSCPTTLKASGTGK